MPSRPLPVALLLVALLLGACRVDATVEIDVSEGGGEVAARFRLDREAVAVIGGRGAGAETSDLERVGWEISPLRETPDGGAEIEARKTFTRAADLGVVIEELAGPAGPLRGFRLDRERSLLSGRYRVRGTADLGPGASAIAGVANSPDLPARLRAAGIDPGRVTELLNGRAAEGFALRLVVDLPGKTESWTLEPGTPSQPVDVASEVDDRIRPALLVIAVLLAAVVLFRLRRRPAQS